ncbi:MAG: flavodoxin family protein [Candidatus Kerfeldbacteria bacterium]|nr:flavodoxin family protein [Candidatus Kerfeldbacteria bacterium]
MYIVGINGSHREQSNSELFLDYVLEKFQTDHEVEKINLLDKHIAFYDACDACVQNKPCHIQDDMHSIFESLLKADVVIFSSPTYYGMPSARLKNLMDRTDMFFASKQLQGKIGVVITNGAGTFAGIELNAKMVRHFFDDHKMVNIPVYACFNNTKDYPENRFPAPLSEKVRKMLDELYENAVDIAEKIRNF